MVLGCFVMSIRIGIIGGAGREGGGGAPRWARAGHEILLGSRDEAKARAKAEELRAAGAAAIEGGSNAWSARAAEVVVLCVPYGVHAETLRGLREELSGKVLIDITVPLKPPKV